MYFKISESKQVEWDGNDKNWYKPVIEHFSFGINTDSFPWFYILLACIIFAAILIYLAYKKKKNN